MKTVDSYNGKNVLVLGLGKSGIAVANLLLKLNANIVINDNKSVDLSENIYKELIDKGVKIITGSHPITLFDENFSFMFKNPGIPYNNIMVEEAKKRNIPILTEPELAYEVLEGSMIGVTGTNGKTTTTTLISLILSEDTSKSKVFTGGNIGIPLSEEAQKVKKNDYLVSELSSFQLMGIKDLKPKIAVLNNIYSAHLDYHGSREEYISAKMNITKNQTSDDYFVVNYGSDEWINLAKTSKAKIISYKKDDTLDTDAYVKDGYIYYHNEKIIAIDEIKIPGSHNVENALAAICVAKILNRSNKDIVKVLSTFGGVKHRIQYVDTINDRLIYNDSKATNIKATSVALSAFSKPINLIAGGLDRGNGFDELIPFFKNVKSIVVYGETADKLIDSATGHVDNIIKVNNLVEAVKESYKLSKPEEIILLSPANASWDQFDTFEQRGDLFIDEIEKLKKEN